jgi:hypothetical protein
MVRYKMLARDVNAAPVQYRTWVVNDTPDYNADLYTGLKSGNDPLIDVSAYLVLDDSAVADFNLPDPTNWKTSYEVLPQGLYHSSLAAIDGYVYLFGGCVTNKIFRAPLDNPASWEDTGANLPTNLYGSQLAVIDGYVYLFGGNTGTPTDHIYSASLIDPLTWTDRGAHLPKKICFSQLAIVDDTIYLFGGKDNLGATNTILSASTASPLSWSNTGSTLSQSVYSSQLAIVDGYIAMYGGLTAPSTPTDTILASHVNDPTFWFPGGKLPYKSHSSQIAAVGDSLYLIGPLVKNPVSSSGTGILTALKSSPFAMIDSLSTIPGEISCSQLGIIYDRLFLFGGNGSSIIWANNNVLKYKIADPLAVAYGEVTRTEVNSAPSELDLFVILGMPPWKTDYGS